MELSPIKDILKHWLTEMRVAFTVENHDRPTTSEGQIGFLPDFCNSSVIANVAIIGQMFAFVITLVTRRISLNILEDLLLISLFVQWIALTSVAALCYTRQYLNRLSNHRALVMAYLLLLCITFVISEAAIWLLWIVGKISTPQPEWHGYFHVQNLTVAAIVNALALRYMLTKHELRQRTLSEAQAKIQALQSRIRPHFVFNSLNIIASLTRSHPTRAESAIEDMADLFRMMLADNENMIPIKKEIEVAKKYLALEQLRLDNRLAIDWDIGTFPRKAAMPVLTLQPLLENAIRHGIEALPDGGTVRIKLWEENDKIHIHITNPSLQGKTKSKQGVYRSLADIRIRFQSLYGDTAVLDTSEENGQFSVTAILPTRGGELEGIKL